MCCSAILRSSTLCMCTLLLSPGDQLISNSSSPVYQLLLAAVGLSKTAKNWTVYTTKLLKVCSCCYDTTTLGAPVSTSVDITVTLVFLWRFSSLHINSGLGACTLQNKFFGLHCNACSIIIPSCCLMCQKSYSGLVIISDFWFFVLLVAPMLIPSWVTNHLNKYLIISIPSYSSTSFCPLIISFHYIWNIVLLL